MMAKEYSYNAACMIIACMWGENIECKHSGNCVRTGFYHSGVRVAEYNENTGHLTIYKQPASHGMRTAYSGRMASIDDTETYDAEGAILARQENDGTYD